MKLLIDGYNLIFQCGLQGRRAGSAALEAARNRLISELTSRLDEATRARTTIVFDAADRPVKEVVDDQRINGMRVVFAFQHEDADALIEELIRKHSSPKNLMVVSSDHRIHKAALRRKATPIDSDVWFDRLNGPTHETDDGQARNSDSTPSPEKRLPPEIETIDWIREFGLHEDSNDWGNHQANSTHPSPFPPGYGDDVLKDGGDDGP